MDVNYAAVTFNLIIKSKIIDKIFLTKCSFCISEFSWNATTIQVNNLRVSKPTTSSEKFCKLVQIQFFFCYFITLLFILTCWPIATTNDNVSFDWVKRRKLFSENKLLICFVSSGQKIEICDKGQTFFLCVKSLLERKVFFNRISVKLYQIKITYSSSVIVRN